MFAPQLNSKSYSSTSQRKKPAQRAFQGLAGSPLSKVEPPTASPLSGAERQRKLDAKKRQDRIKRMLEKIVAKFYPELSAGGKRSLVDEMLLEPLDVWQVRRIEQALKETEIPQADRSGQYKLEIMSNAREKQGFDSDGEEEQELEKEYTAHEILARLMSISEAELAAYRDKLPPAAKKKLANRPLSELLAYIRAQSLDKIEGVFDASFEHSYHIKRGQHRRIRPQGNSVDKNDQKGEQRKTFRVMGLELPEETKKGKRLRELGRNFGDVIQTSETAKLNAERDAREAAFPSEIRARAENAVKELYAQYDTKESATENTIDEQRTLESAPVGAND